MSWIRKIFHLPGTRLTPEVVLHRTLTKVDHVEAVTVIIQWKDGTYAVDWSQQKVRDLCMASMVLHDKATDAMHGHDP